MDKFKNRRDTGYLAFAEKLIEVLPEKREEWALAIAQHVYDLVTPEEYIDQATRVRLLVEHDNPSYPKVTVVCPDVLDLPAEQVNDAIKRLCKLAGLSTDITLHPSVSIDGNAAGSVIITGNNSNVFRSHEDT